MTTSLCMTGLSREQRCSQESWGGSCQHHEDKGQHSVTGKPAALAGIREERCETPAAAPLWSASTQREQELSWIFPSPWTAGLPGSEAMAASSGLWKQMDSKSEGHSHQHINKARVCNRLCAPSALPKQLLKLSSSTCIELILKDLRCCKR